MRGNIYQYNPLTVDIYSNHEIAMNRLIGEYLIRHVKGLLINSVLFTEDNSPPCLINEAVLSAIMSSFSKWHQESIGLPETLSIIILNYVLNNNCHFTFFFNELKLILLSIIS